MGGLAIHRSKIAVLFWRSEAFLAQGRKRFPGERTS
jgi:hypothetical protein